MITFALALALAAAQQTGKLEISVVENGAPAACRIHLKDAAGKPVKASAYTSWNDHFVCDGAATLDLPPGRYHLEVERGPEHAAHGEDVDVAAGAAKKVAVELKRLVDLSAQGWWSGELHVHRPLKDVELLMRAEDLHVAPVITWWNQKDLWAGKEIPALQVAFDKDRFIHIMAGEDEREGGALMYYSLPKPLAISGATREYPSPVTYLLEAKKTPGVHVDVEKPFWWDLPVWLATGKVDTLGIAVNHMCRSQMYESEAWGKPRPVDRLPAPLGNGHWVQEIYYHALNCGLRISPSAGSASGVLANPVGYNRAYVHLDGPPSYDKWMEGLRAGRSFVTNGPLLRVKANGEHPGAIFVLDGKQASSVNLTVELDGRDEMTVLDIVMNGKVVHQDLVKDVKASGSLGRLELDTPGWFLVRVLAKNDKTFRFASTAPFYVEGSAKQRRISKASAKFFADWVDERMARVPLKLKDEKQLDEVLEPHRKAREFWADLLNRANAD